MSKVSKERGRVSVTKSFLKKLFERKDRKKRKFIFAISKNCIFTRNEIKG